jgi:DNA-binding NtrC family response regulator
MMPASPKDLPSTAVAGLAQLLDASGRPIYAVGSDRRIVYCNASLASWLGTERSQIVGRFVEYHSLPNGAAESTRTPARLLTDLCPPPVALVGKQCSGTVATVAREGRLIHRRADFLPLIDGETAGDGNGAASAPAGILVLLAPVDMLPHELTAEVAEEAAPDELHRAIRRFRQTQSEEYVIESLLGTSSAIEKVRAQVAAAAAGRASVLVRGRRGSGRAHVARAIHYQSAWPTDRLLPLDCQAATEDILRRLLDSVRGKSRSDRRTTLLLLDLQQLPAAVQPQLLAAIKDVSPSARIIATTAFPVDETNGGDGDSASANSRLDPRLLDAVSTITIDVPRLTDRLADLPLLAQSFVEARNRGGDMQIGAIRSDALDVLALYRWPGELDELREVIAAAHAACTGHQITPGDLPAVVHHAAKTAALARRVPPERIVLDEFLASIEREVIGRALADAGGNKTAAAELLGMTRPRLYRRLVQLGLVSESTIEFHEEPAP